ncbi:hypothetical protein M9458_038548, partial [Cirrhinus mrigala]
EPLPTTSSSCVGGCLRTPLLPGITLWNSDGEGGGIRGGLAAARWGWQRLEEVTGTCAVIDRLEMDSVYVLRVRGCNKAGFGEYSEEVYLHTPPAP